jgi:hypothetical protein
MPREVVMGLDNLERGVGLFAGGVALIMAIVQAIEAHRAKNTLSYKYVKGTACKAGYHHVLSFCEKLVPVDAGKYLFSSVLIALLGLALLYFSQSRKRPGVIFVAVFLFLALGASAGILFLFMGAWLMIRAFRLQKYGDATFSGSGRRAREMGQAKREARDPSTRKARASKSKSKTAAQAGPSPSKRYTPKKPTRRS